MKQWIREGFSTYYVVEKEKEITYEKDILRSHSIECLLPCEIRMLEDQEYYYYETGIYTPLFDKIDKINPKTFFYALFQKLKLLEGYLLALDHLQLDKDLLFLDKEEEPVLCYLPEYEKNIMEQVRGLLEVCIDKISYEDKKKSRFYYDFHGFLMRQRPNIEQILEYLKPELIKEQQKVKIPKEEKREEIIPEPVSKGKKKLTPVAIVLLLMNIPFAAVAVFFAVRIYFYGLYGPYMAGFGVPCGMLCADLYYLWTTYTQNQRYKKKIVIPIEDDKTQLLEDEEKTVLLMEEPMGKLKSPKHEIILGESGFVIGSGKEGVDYQLSAVGVSRKHMKLIRQNGAVYVEDMNSTNGTYINGNKVYKKKLEEGDVLRIGREEFQFSLDK